MVIKSMYIESKKELFKDDSHEFCMRLWRALQEKKITVEQFRKKLHMYQEGIFEVKDWAEKNAKK